MTTKQSGDKPKKRIGCFNGIFKKKNKPVRGQGDMQIVELDPNADHDHDYVNVDPSWKTGNGHYTVVQDTSTENNGHANGHSGVNGWHSKTLASEQPVEEHKPVKRAPKEAVIGYAEKTSGLREHGQLLEQHDVKGDKPSDHVTKDDVAIKKAALQKELGIPTAEVEAKGLDDGFHERPATPMKEKTYDDSELYMNLARPATPMKEKAEDVVGLLSEGKAPAFEHVQQNGHGDESTGHVHFAEDVARPRCGVTEAYDDNAFSQPVVVSHEEEEKMNHRYGTTDRPENNSSVVEIGEEDEIMHSHYGTTDQPKKHSSVVEIGEEDKTHPHYRTTDQPKKHSSVVEIGEQDDIMHSHYGTTDQPKKHSSVVDIGEEDDKLHPHYGTTKQPKDHSSSEHYGITEIENVSLDPYKYGLTREDEASDADSAEVHVAPPLQEEEAQQETAEALTDLLNEGSFTPYRLVPIQVLREKRTSTSYDVQIVIAESNDLKENEADSPSSKSSPKEDGARFVFHIHRSNGPLGREMSFEMVGALPPGDDLENGHLANRLMSIWDAPVLSHDEITA